eukprot:Partr_v1_DN28085_c1_g1_i3_m57502 putative serine threonine-protein kinase
MKGTITLALLCSMNSIAASKFYFTSHGNLEAVWRFNDTLIITSGYCGIYRANTIDENSIVSLYEDPITDGESICHCEGMVSPVDEHFYLFQVSQGEQLLRVFDLGHIDQVGKQCKIGALQSGYSSAVFVIDIPHTLLYVAQDKVIQVIDISNPLDLKPIAALPSGADSLEYITLHKNHLYFGQRDFGVSRMALDSANYSVIEVMPPITTRDFYVNSIFPDEKVLIISVGNLQGGFSKSSSYWMDPVSFEILYTSNVTHKGCQLFPAENLLMSFVGVWSAAMDFQLHDIRDISSPVFVTSLTGGPVNANAQNRVLWDDRILYIPNYWGLDEINDIETYIPKISAHYAATYSRPYGYFQHPLCITGSLSIEAVKRSFEVLSPAILRVSDAFPPQFLKVITISFVATSSSGSVLQVKSDDAIWKSLNVGDSFDASFIEQGKVRVFIAERSTLTLSARQLGIPTDNFNLAIALTESQQQPEKSVGFGLTIWILLIAGVVILTLILGVVIAVYRYCNRSGKLRNLTYTESETAYSISSYSASIITGSSSEYLSASTAATDSTLFHQTSMVPLALPGHLEFSLGDYKLLKTIGHGGMGDVYLGEAIDPRIFDDSSKMLAVKKIGSESHTFVQEVAIMNALKHHPYFAKLLGYCSDSKDILIRYYNCGNLVDFLHRNSKLTKRTGCVMLISISRGLAIMHRRGFAHCDIKAENILLRSNDKGQVSCVISDFGITKIVTSSSLQVKAFSPMVLNGLSAKYAAPELFSKTTNLSTELFAVDVYAFGVLMNFILKRREPWTSRE